MINVQGTPIFDLGNEQYGIRFFKFEMDKRVNYIFELHLVPFSFNVTVSQWFLSMTLAVSKFVIQVGAGV